MNACAHLCSTTAPAPSPATARPSVKPKSTMSTSLRAAVSAVLSPCAGTIEAVGPVQLCSMCDAAWLWLVVQSHTGDGGKAVMGSTCASLLHAWAVLLEGMKWPWPCCLLPHWSSDWHSSGATEMLWGAEVAAVLPAAGICSSTALHYPVVSGSLCQTRNKVSGWLPGVLATQALSGCLLFRTGPWKELCSGIQEDLPAALPHML